MAERIVNFDDIVEKGKVITFFRQLKGKWRLTVVRERKRRSDAQNRMLWGCVYPYVSAGLLEAWGENISNDEVHEMMKDKFLRTRQIVNHNTGEVKASIVASSAVLSTTEFSEYVENIAKFAAEDLGVAIPSPCEIETHEQPRVR